MSRLLRIGELANLSGVSTRTVDFYTGLGLIEAAQRTAGNFRLYDPSCVDRIAAIKVLEANGVSLSDMAGALQRGAGDLAVQLSQVQGDLEALQQAAAHAGPAAHQLLLALTARLQSLIATALDLTNNLPPL
ncbi:MerR family transcriptional regulator [Dactylosporangium sp. AC04546]|uniref:MerR family transcriptional regulator n=1 Tax=unclassified Dactylosporangium TaxID=2621675 RepID=UPI001EDCD2FF|nr:MerR family transcriptional regulator [Dactylosporangium sp. AC04546]WVK86041.1 MerR family transcriptional regulator [Dactylosporangium sp. AC04546]